MFEHTEVGAQVLQATLGTANCIFYLSPMSIGVSHAGNSAVPLRGGVPVLFPQFGDRGLLPKHGFVRTARWNLRETRKTPGACWVRYSLSIPPNEHVHWAHACHLALRVEATANALGIALAVTNTGDDFFSWTGGLHPYFLVQDLLTSSLSGLQGLGAQDRYDPNVKCQTQDQLEWSGQPFERLYDASPPLILSTGRLSLHLSASGFDQWMVWNPGEAGVTALTDLPAGDWRRFVCVEPVRVSRPVVLAPGETFEGKLLIGVGAGGAGS